MCALEIALRRQPRHFVWYTAFSKPMYRTNDRWGSSLGPQLRGALTGSSGLVPITCVRNGGMCMYYNKDICTSERARVCKFALMHMYVYIYAYACKYGRTCVHTHMCTYMYMHRHAHTYMYGRGHVHPHAYMVYICKYVHAYEHIDTHTFITTQT